MNKRCGWATLVVLGLSLSSPLACKRTPAPAPPAITNVTEATASSALPQVPACAAKANVIGGIAIAEDGHRLIATVAVPYDADKSLVDAARWAEVWDLSTGALERTLDVGGRAVSIDQRGSAFVATLASEEEVGSIVRFFDPKTFALLSEHKEYGLSELVIADDEHVLLAGLRENHTLVDPRGTRAPIMRPYPGGTPGPSSRNFAVALSPDRKVIALVEGTVVLHDARTLAATATAKTTYGNPTVAWTLAGDAVIVGDSDVDVFDGKTLARKKSLVSGTPPGEWNVVVAKTSGWIAAVGEGELRVWDATLTKRKGATLPSSGRANPEWSADGASLLLTNQAGDVQLYDTKSESVRVLMPAASSEPSADSWPTLDLSPDGASIAVIVGEQLELHELATFKLVWKRALEGGAASHQVAFAPDGSFVAYGGPGIGLARVSDGAWLQLDSFGAAKAREGLAYTASGAYRGSDALRGCARGAAKPMVKREDVMKAWRP